MRKGYRFFICHSKIFQFGAEKTAFSTEVQSTQDIMQTK